MNAPTYVISNVYLKR